MEEPNKNLIRVSAFADVAKHVGESNQALRQDLQSKKGAADLAQKFWNRANSLMELVDKEHEDIEERRIAKTWLMKIAGQLQIEGRTIRSDIQKTEGRIAQTEATAQWIRKRAEAEEAAAERAPVEEAIQAAREPKKPAKKAPPKRRRPTAKKSRGKN